MSWITVIAASLFLVLSGELVSAHDGATAAADAASAEEPAAGTAIAAPRIVPNTLPILPVQKRLFGVIPNYRADQDSPDYHPLTVWEKFKIAEKDSFDWPNYFMTAGFAMQTQMAVSGMHGRAMGRTFAGYYARSFADQLIGSYITEAAMPALLHEDPRFFRSGTGTLTRRSWRAVRQVLVTRTQNGKERFNFSEILGNSAVTAVTSLYYPDNRKLSAGAERVALQLGNDAISNMLTEFWPDIRRRAQAWRHH
jgi:hypothetical protein